jgi:iron(III) transport system substrate-binding protein
MASMLTAVRFNEQQALVRGCDHRFIWWPTGRHHGYESGPHTRCHEPHAPAPFAAPARRRHRRTYRDRADGGRLFLQFELGHGRLGRGVTLEGIIAYNKQKVKNPPTTWAALESAAWKGQVGMDDPSQSGPTYPLIAGVMNYLGSVAKGEQYFEALKANGLVINPTNGPTLQALTSGRINLALVQSSAAIGAMLGDKNIGLEYLAPATLLPSQIGIDAHASAQEQKEAEEFVDFVLSPAGQKVMQSGDPTGDSLYYPVVQDVHPLPALPSLASVKTQTINPYTWGPQEGTINNWFDANIVR